MLRSALALTALLFLASGAARATNGPSCCACLGESVQPGGGGPAQAPPPVEALFCASSNGRGSEQTLADRCDVLNGQLTCVADGSVDCRTLLAGEGILCPPGAAAAPLLSPLALGGLALALAGFGVGVMRRRGRAA